MHDAGCKSAGEPDDAPADALPDVAEAVEASAGQLAALADMHDDPDKRRAMFRRLQPLTDAGWTPSGILDRWPKAAIEIALGVRPAREGETVASNGS